MVSGRSAVETAGRSVFQWADTATIALGRGNRLPSEARKSRAGRFSRIRVGDPCDTKTVGIDIASILTQHLQSAKQEEELMRGLCTRAALALAIWASLAVPTMAQTTLRMVSHADIKILDPIWTTALISRNFGYMIY